MSLTEVRAVRTFVTNPRVDGAARARNLVDADPVNSCLGPTRPHRLLGKDDAGRGCHRVPELHLVDRQRGFGGFFGHPIILSR